MNSEQTLLINTFPAFHRIHLDNDNIRILLTEEKVVSISTANPAGFILLDVLRTAFPTSLVTYLAREIQIADSIEDTGIYIGIDGLRTIADNFFANCLDDMVNGLSLVEPCLERRGKLQCLIFIDDKT